MPGAMPAPTASRPRWHEPAGVLAFFVVLVAAMFLPLFSGHRWFLWDVPDEYWGDLVYLCHSLRDRAWPAWNPFDRFGYPFLADPQAGLFNPLNHALCLVTGGDPPLFAAEIRVPIYFVLGGCATVGFLRALGLALGPAMLGGVAFVLAPYPRRMWEVNLSYAIACLPVVLWAIERLAQSPDRRRAAMLALVAAFATSVGSPPSLYFTVLTAAVFAAVRCATDRRTWGPLALAGALAVAMCAVMIIPTREMASLSVQQGTDFASISAGGYSLREFVGLAWPRNKYLYLGVPVIALALLGAVHPRSPLPRRVRVAFGVLALIALAMTFGAHTPLYRVMFTVVPGVRAFRAPVRYSAVLGACAAFLAAAGVAVVPRPRVAIPLAIALVIAVAWPALPEDRDLRGGPVPGGAARWGSFRARMEDVTARWRVLDEFGLGLRAGSRFGFRDARGYQDPLSLQRYSRVINALDHAPTLLPQFNVRYLLRGAHFIHGNDHHFLPVGTEARIADDRGDGLWEVRDAMPRAYFTARAMSLPDADAVFDRLRAVAPAPVCLLDDGTPARDDARDDWRAASIVGSRADRLDLEIDAPSSGWLVVNDAWYPGWRATVDNRATSIHRANYLVRAIEVPAGRHRVAMWYAPAYDKPLRALAAVALLVALALAFARAPRRTTS